MGMIKKTYIILNYGYFFIRKCRLEGKRLNSEKQTSENLSWKWPYIYIYSAIDTYPNGLWSAKIMASTKDLKLIILNKLNSKGNFSYTDVSTCYTMSSSVLKSLERQTSISL